MRNRAELRRRIAGEEEIYEKKIKGGCQRESGTHSNIREAEIKSRRRW